MGINWICKELGKSIKSLNMEKHHLKVEWNQEWSEKKHNVPYVEICFKNSFKIDTFFGTFTFTGKGEVKYYDEVVVWWISRYNWREWGGSTWLGVHEKNYSGEGVSRRQCFQFNWPGRVSQRLTSYCLRRTRWHDDLAECVVQVAG